MTPLALKRAVAPERSERRFRRAPLAMKLAIAFVGLVAFVLIVNGAIDTYLTYNQAKRAALEVASEKARAAAERVGVFLDEIQTELGWTAGVEWGYAKPEQQRYDFIRLLRQTPAITALSYIDGKGREQLAVSRLAPDVIGSGKDFSADPRFVRAVADKVWFGPVEFRRGSEPYMTVALAHVGKTPGVTVADVNLKLIWDVINAIHVGNKGFAYVVDGKGRLIAHPDLSLVLRDTDLSHLPQVAAALAERGASEAEVARSLDGAAVLTAHAVAPRTHWTVFVEQPLAEALATAYRSLLRSLALLGFGLTLAAVSGVALARRMAAPIRLLQAGAEKLGSGDLAQRLDIRTGDEIEALAGGFNRMAERLQESYETLESKVEARTRDLNEALAQQTATADVLKVISRSAFGLKTVLQTLVDSAVRLCASDGVIYLRDGDVFRAEAEFGAEIAGQDSRNRSPRRPGRDSITGRVALSGRVEQIPDNEADPEFQVAPAQRMKMRAMLGVPLLREGEVEGVFVLAKPEPGLFGERAVEVVRTFADQAVIAIQNVRLFEEVRARTREVEEALAYQVATSDVLGAIGTSMADPQRVFERITDAVQHLMPQTSAGVFLLPGDGCAHLAAHQFSEALKEHYPAPVSRTYGSALVAHQQIYLPSILHSAEAMSHQRRIAETIGDFSIVDTAMVWEGRALGFISTSRRPPRPFSEREFQLLKTFADQAVIAIENARLFAEVQARTRDLEESLAQQTATAEVLKVISRSAFDLDAIFQTLVATAVELCAASSGTLCVRDGDIFRYRGMAGPEASPTLQQYLAAHPLAAPDRRTVAGRAILSRQTEEIADVLAEADYAVPFAASGSSARSLLGVPLLGKTEVLGAIVVTRPEPGSFSRRHVEILRTFADQAVIAIENTRLFDEVQARTRELEQSIADLRKAQDRLVQSEKLASLGQLTAGIAHEIKNPLNFVNNFSSLSRELLEELRETLQKLPTDIGAGAEELIGLIDSNLEKVANHGRRADSIVRNMLLHSREGSGERSRVNINAMVEEALNLGYHGARAEKPGFNVNLEKDFDPEAGEADIYVQEVTRVLLNLISNGFYASAKRKLSEGRDYGPTLKATTRDLGQSVEIRIRDNGTGIPAEVRAKMFNPFFTTKPAGEGTGLGLSLSHDIVVKQHGGTLDVETAPGAFTEFVITLPREGAGA